MPNPDSAPVSPIPAAVTSSSPAAFFSTFSPTYRAESARIRSCPWNQPVVVVPRKMMKALIARASAAGVLANCTAMTHTTAPATSPLPVLASMVNLVAANRSASEPARASAWASTQGTDTVATVVAHSSSPWPAANAEYCATSSRWVSTSAYR